jgi:hypothetical protein
MAIGDVGRGRTLALTPAQVASPLAGRPYDLRHAAVSLWLNAGVPVPQVAEHAAHSVEVLLWVYAKCLDDGDQAASACIDLRSAGVSLAWCAESGLTCADACRGGDGRVTSRWRCCWSGGCRG